MAQNIITGIALRDADVEWSVLRRPRDRAETAQSERITLAGGAETPDLPALLQKDRAAVLKDLRSHSGSMPGDVALGLPSTWVLTRVLTLPTAAPAELRGMVELQVDKFSPFPVESTVIAYEVIEQQGDQSRVVVAQVQTERVDQIGALFAEAGVRLRWVDASVMAWWRLLADGGHIPATGSQIVLLLDGGTCDLILVQGGQPAAFRSIGMLHGLPPDQVADEVLRETLFTLASSATEEHGEQPTTVSLWYRGEEPAVLVSGLQDALGVQVQQSSLAALPPLAQGVALRRAAPTHEVLDLTPLTWHAADRRRLFRQRLIALTAATLGVWLVAVAVLLGGLQIQKQRLAGLEGRLKNLDAPVRKVRGTRERALALTQYVDRTHSALECLREVSDLLPPGIELKTFNYRKGKNVELSGEATSITLVYDFKKELDQSEMFAATKLHRVVKGPKGQEVFKITAIMPGGTE